MGLCESHDVPWALTSNVLSFGDEHGLEHGYVEKTSRVRSIYRYFSIWYMFKENVILNSIHRFMWTNNFCGLFQKLHIWIIVFVMSKHVDHRGGKFASLELVEIHLEFKGSAHVAPAEKTTALPSLKLVARTWTWIVGIPLFPFGSRPIFRCELLVVGSVSENKCINLFVEQVVKILFRMDFRILVQPRCGCIAWCLGVLKNISGTICQLFLLGTKLLANFKEFRSIPFIYSFARPIGF